MSSSSAILDAATCVSMPPQCCIMGARPREMLALHNDITSFLSQLLSLQLERFVWLSVHLPFQSDPFESQRDIQKGQHRSLLGEN